jgi:hypothetical protein
MYEILVFFSSYIQKKYDLCHIGRHNILQLVCDLKRSKFNLIKNTNKKQSYVR